MMAAAIVPTAGMIGSGIDFGRAYLAESKLQGAVDAAALAAVRAKQIAGSSNTRAIAVGREYLAANYPDDYMQSITEDAIIEITDIDDVIRATVTISGTVDTTLLKVLDIDTLDINVSSTAEASDTLPTAVEALLVLDNTGSMQGSRMTQLKAASKNFVDIIYGSEETRTNFAVGILPYNTMVNTGRLVQASDASMVVERRSFTNINVNNDTGWKGCLAAAPTVQNIGSDPDTVETGAFDITDNMPGEDGMPPFEPFVYPPIYVDSFQDVNNRYILPGNRWKDFYRIPAIKDAMIDRYGDDICVRRNNGNPIACDHRAASIDPTKLPDYDEFVEPRRYNHYSGSSENSSPSSQWGASPNYQCPSQALPLSYSATKSGLKAYIDDENEALRPGTGTFHSPAMTWAYRLMTRDDIFARDTPDDIPVKRVVIFMTDGNFDSRDDGRRDADNNKILDTAYTAYGTYEDRRLISNTSRNDTITQLIRRFSKTCAAMKRDGIEIYTIAFALSNSSESNRTREMFRSCATDRNTHFYSAANGTQLNDAFVTIAAELIDLRLTQ